MPGRGDSRGRPGPGPGIAGGPGSTRRVSRGPESGALGPAGPGCGRRATRGSLASGPARIGSNRAMQAVFLGYSASGYGSRARAVKAGNAAAKPLPYAARRSHAHPGPAERYRGSVAQSYSCARRGSGFAPVSLALALRYSGQGVTRAVGWARAYCSRWGFVQVYCCSYARPRSDYPGVARAL